ncbi:MAG: VWA domain-containing protein, partial [Candidatus Bipolaricaulia bacterium]
MSLVLFALFMLLVSWVPSVGCSESTLVRGTVTTPPVVDSPAGFDYLFIRIAEVQQAAPGTVSVGQLIQVRFSGNALETLAGVSQGDYVEVCANWDSYLICGELGYVRKVVPCFDTDLLVSVDDITVSGSESREIAATIHNVGENDARAVMVQFEHASCPCGDGIIAIACGPGMGRRSETIVNFIPKGGTAVARPVRTQPVSPGSTGSVWEWVTVAVDPYNVIPERNEDNNEAQKTISVCPDDRIDAKFVPDGWPEECQVSSGSYLPGEKVRADCRVKNTGSAQASFVVVFTIRYPDGRTYSATSKPETILPGRRHTYLADQDNLLLQIPADAPGGLYDVRLEVKGHETGVTYDVWPDEGWRRDQFRVEADLVSCADTIVTGEVVSKPVYSPFRHFDLRIDDVIKNGRNAPNIAFGERIFVFFSSNLDQTAASIEVGDCVRVAGMWEENVAQSFPGLQCDPSSCSDNELGKTPCTSCDRLDWPIAQADVPSGQYVINLAYGDYENRLHDGIDILCDPDTPVYAVESGTALRRDDGAFQERLEVTGECYTIQYTHIVVDEKVVAAGYVSKGQTIGSVVDFADYGEEELLNHLHFSLRDRSDKGKPAANPLLILDPGPLRKDTRAPTIEEVLFRENEQEDWWDHNNFRKYMSRDEFLASADLHGEVDIVVLASDTIGEADPKPMERTGVHKIGYTIVDALGNTLDERTLIEWNESLRTDGCSLNTAVGWVYEQPWMCSTNPRLELEHEWTTFRGQHRMWYIVTNTTDDDSGSIDDVDYRACWDTTERNSDGSPKYPNGAYTICITASDAAGNPAEPFEIDVTVNNSRRALIIAPFYTAGKMKTPAIGYSKALAKRLNEAGWVVQHLGDNEEVYKAMVLEEFKRPYDLIHITTHGGPQSFAVDPSSASDNYDSITAQDIEPFPDGAHPLVYLAYCWSNDPEEDGLMPSALVKKGASACVGFTKRIYFCDPNPEADLCRLFGDRSAYDVAKDFYDSLASGKSVGEAVVGNCACSQTCPCNGNYDSCLANNGPDSVRLDVDSASVESVPDLSSDIPSSPSLAIDEFVEQAQVGDIVLVAHPDGIGLSCSGFDHVALVTDQDQVTEAQKDCGVCTYSLSTFVRKYLNYDAYDWVDIRLFRVRTTDAVRAEACQFALDKASDPDVRFGDYFNYLRPPAVDTDAYYCSHLVWAAYKHADSDLEIDDGGMYWIRPSELADSQDTYEVARLARGMCTEEPSGIHSSTALVIDTSGSMAWDDPTGASKIEAARKAAMTFISMLETENRAFGAEHEAALISFNTAAVISASMTGDLTVIRDRISSLTADGGTNLYQALSLANSELSSTDGQPVIILLSDGVPTVGPSESDDFRVHERDVLSGPIQEAASSGHCIFAVGFGVPGEIVSGDPSIDPEFLNQAVRATGCSSTYYPAAEAFELIERFIDMRQASMDRTEVGRATSSIQQGETLTLETIMVPFEQNALYVTLAWPGSALDLNLKDPGGRLVDDAYPGATIDVYENMVYAIVEDPAPGTWQASVYGRNVPTGTTQFAFLASVEAAKETTTPVPPTPDEPELGMLRFAATGPVDLVLRDPEGRIVSKEFAEVDGITYVEEPDADGITVPNRVVGDYEVRVIPEEGADRLGRYSLTATDGFDIVTLADRKFIIHVPDEPYVVRSTLDGFFDATGSSRAPTPPPPEPEDGRGTSSTLTIIL